MQAMSRVLIDLIDLEKIRGSWGYGESAGAGSGREKLIESGVERRREGLGERRGAG